MPLPAFFSCHASSCSHNHASPSLYSSCEAARLTVMRLHPQTLWRVPTAAASGMTAPGGGAGTMHGHPSPPRGHGRRLALRAAAGWDGRDASPGRGRLGDVQPQPLWRIPTAAARSVQPQPLWRIPTAAVRANTVRPLCRSSARLAVSAPQSMRPIIDYPPTSWP